jgi:uncharacterized protein with HEPN domain
MAVYNTNRYIVSNDMHFNSFFFSDQTVSDIQNIVLKRLGIRVSPEQIKNVMDSVYQSAPRIGLEEMIKMCSDYIVSYIQTEQDIMNQNTKYDISVQKYDGSFGIQQFSTGQVPIRKKGLNRFQMRMIY